MTTDHLALTSDCAKYTPVAEDENGHRQSVVKQETDNPECLLDKRALILSLETVKFIIRLSRITVNYIITDHQKKDV